MSFPSPLPGGFPVLESLEGVRKNWWLMLLIGIALLVVGTFAIVWSCAATITSVVLFGILLLIGGALQIISAFYSRGWGGFFLSLLVGVLYIIVGFFMIERPIEAAAGLTLMIAVALILGGAIRVVIALVERFSHWGWVLLNGVITFMLGLIIWRQWPLSGLWVIGLFAGIEMIFCGWAWVMFSLALRPASRSPV
jgi:uncharacterized membrane protein HdeD (DUF308 family)